MKTTFKLLGKEAIAYEFQIGGMRMVSTNLDTATEIVLNDKLNNILPYTTLDRFTFELQKLSKKEPALRIQVIPTATFHDELLP